MSELEYSLKEVISKLDTTVNTLSDTVNKLCVSIVTDYQKKTDCEICKSELHDRINTANSWIIGLYGIILAAVGLIITMK